MPASRLRKRFFRQSEIESQRLRLERDGYPRLQMSLLVAITGAAGFLGSFAMLHAGLDTMWIRYLAAFGIAYLVFLFLLWCWLRSFGPDGLDLPDLPDMAGGGRNGPGFAGKGGSFDGAGASGDWDGNTVMVVDGDAPSVSLPFSDSMGDAAGSAADADELAIPLLALIVIAAIVLSSLWVIWSAPLLFAELSVDGVLAASLYRRLRGLQARHWLETAVRRTVLPFLLTGLVVAAAGWGLQQAAPQARSFGEALHHAGWVGR